MRKLFLVLPLILVIVTFTSLSTTAYAIETGKQEYDIQLETLSSSSDAKELNKYRKEFLKYFNQKAKDERKASGNNSYNYLSIKDLDFTDSSKVSGIKRHGSYSNCEFDTEYDVFVKSLGKHDFWRLSIIKGNTLYDVGIFKSDNPKQYDGNAYNIGGNWYIHSCYLYLKELNWTGALIYNPDVIKENVGKLLEYYNVEGKRVNIIYTNIGDYMYTQCAVVFIDGRARYIYAANFRIPYNNLRDDTPQEIRDVLSECASGLFSASYEQKSTEIKRFRDYNMVMSLFRLYEYYKATNL